ncbi:DMT family transporter [Chitinophaga oryzae]|uniref:DMT family transporter n=1 Tax=Chitinophaga oryzae TaxID=2725414 RepID=A0AAE7D5V3_9BACT|nr:DMT family transporter [Chitinophaga oryzae]QJB30615.1 DMT family transporter [Chitinophaga oryzae]
MQKSRLWLLYTAINTIFIGIWGAFIELPEKAGFPATLGYVVWVATMLPCTLLSLYLTGWKLETDLRSIFLGAMVGLLGAGGQLMLFEALRIGPAYILFPLITLFPLLTILLSVVLLRETCSRRQWTGIAVALLAAFFLAFQPGKHGPASGNIWLIMAMVVFVMWGTQAYVMKFANNTMKAESIFFYMAVASLLLVPVALAMTDFSQPINWGWKGFGMAIPVHLLNAIGALMLVYALRFGKAIIVIPLTSLSSVITVILSLIIYGVVPDAVLSAGLLLASVAIVILSE